MFTFNNVVEAFGGPVGLFLWAAFVLVIYKALFGKRGGVGLGEPPSGPKPNLKRQRRD